MKFCPNPHEWGQGIRNGLQSMGLTHDRAEDFYMGKWHTKDSSSLSRNVYAVARLGMALYLLAWYPVLVAIMTPKYFYLYFTDWGYTLITLDAIFQAVLAVMYRNIKEATRDERNPGILPVLFRVSWAITYICSATSFTVSLGYWILIYPHLENRLPLLYDAHLHLVNAIYVIASVFVAKRPFKWQHFYFPLIKITVFVLFSFIYWMAGGRSALGEEFLYPFLNFRDMKVLFGFGSILIIATLICHLLLCSLDFCGRKIMTRSPSQNENGGNEEGSSPQQDDDAAGPKLEEQEAYNNKQERETSSL